GGAGDLLAEGAVDVELVEQRDGVEAGDEGERGGEGDRPYADVGGEARGDAVHGGVEPGFEPVGAVADGANGILHGLRRGGSGRGPADGRGRLSCDRRMRGDEGVDLRGESLDGDVRGLGGEVLQDGDELIGMNGGGELEAVDEPTGERDGQPDGEDG